MDGIRVILRSRESGLTLLELLIALVILALLTSLSLPGLRDLVESKRGEILMNRLAQGLQLARAAAVSSGGLVTICRSSDARECGGDWVDGVLIFHDADGDRQLDDGQQPLRYLDFGDSGGTLRWRAFGNRQYLQFTPLGFTRAQNGSFTYCPENGDPRLARQLILNRPGRARHAMDQDGDGVVEDSRGKPLSC